MRKRSMIQKVIMGISVVSYITAIACGVVAAIISDGTQNAAVASMMASVVFFAGTGIVLHIISSSNLPRLNVERERT